MDKRIMIIKWSVEISIFNAMARINREIQNKNMSLVLND